MSASPSSFRDWSQGDATLDVRAVPFVSCGDEVVDVAVEGVVVVTQTCDILNIEDGPNVPALVQVAGLVKVDARFVEETKRYWKPRYMHIPALADRELVADLNLCATFDRGVLDEWTRIPRADDPASRKATEFALGRHRSRHAFPDRWSPAFSKVRDWVRGKGGKTSDEGRFVDAIEEMRIVADEAETPDKALVIVIISKSVPQTTRSKWTIAMLPKLKDRVDEGWKCEVSFVLRTLAEMTAEEYVASALMDFDALTKAANDDRPSRASSTPEGSPRADERPGRTS